MAVCCMPGLARGLPCPNNYRTASKRFIGCLSPHHRLRVLRCSENRPDATSHRVASVSDSQRTRAALQQRHGPTSEVAQHQHGQHNSHHRASSTDDSLRIIMLLSLSLTLMLLPWMSRHPEFLIAPLLLAFTPVVGNGVRPVLKEAGAGLLTTIKLSLGLLTHHEQHPQLPHGHAHHHSHGHSHSHHQQQQLHQQQRSPSPQRSRTQQQQQQHAPAGPYSPWPNPARMPAPWPPTAAGGAAVPPAAAAADESDSDWAPSTPPDPHHADPHSRQHLRQVLAADQQVERELGMPAAAAAGAAASSGAAGSEGRLRGNSPSGSPSHSMDNPCMDNSSAAHSHHHQQQQQQQHHHHAHVRDPRVLSKEAKQQLYHQQHHAGSGSSGGGQRQQ